MKNWLGHHRLLYASATRRTAGGSPLVRSVSGRSGKSISALAADVRSAVDHVEHFPGENCWPRIIAILAISFPPISAVPGKTLISQENR